MRTSSPSSSSSSSSNAIWALLIFLFLFGTSSTTSSEVTHDAISRVAARFATGDTERVEVKLVKGGVDHTLDEDDEVDQQSNLTAESPENGVTNKATDVEAQMKKLGAKLNELNDNATNAAIVSTKTAQTTQNKVVAGAAVAAAEAKKNVKVPRVWESNAQAVMKIIVKDDNKGDAPDKGAKGKVVTDHTTYLTMPDLATLQPDEAAHEILSSLSGISSGLHKRLTTMYTKATSHECRVMIAEHMALFVNGLAEETKFPFEDFYFPNTCTSMTRYADWENLPVGVTAQKIQYVEYQPPKDSVPAGTYLENVDELQLLYVILTHDQPEATIRLIESVNVPGKTKYVIHVDGKEQADETYERLVDYAKEMNAKPWVNEEYIRIVPNKNRVRVNWGGYSMVEATLMALHTVFGLDYYDDHPEEEDGRDDNNNPHAFTFHKLVHLASTTYPLASNTEIRDTLSSYPLDANMLHIILRPNNPTPTVWNYFVECDDALHRIYRIPSLNKDRGHGIDIYTSSQWFIISRDFAWYLARPPKDSFVEYYLKYVKHVVVADESFFGTVVRNTHFCSTLHNHNFLHLQFDRWENEATGGRDERKCVMKQPNHCGRSPTTMTVDYLPVLELSGDLFARKFDDIAEPLVKDYIDLRRAKEEERLKRESEYKDKNETESEPPLEEWEFQGEGVMIVAKETVNDTMPLCMGLGKDGNAVKLQPCFKEDVPSTLSVGWEEGAVIIEEIEGFNRWDIGPCSSDGELKRNATGELEMIPGVYAEKGPSCGIKVGDGLRKGRCLDIESEITRPGGMLNVYPCAWKWYQLFSFGNGTIAPRGSIHASLPLHMARQQEKKDFQVYQHLCLGVYGRGNANESEWKTVDESEPWDPWECDDDERSCNDIEKYSNGRKSLQLWRGQHLETTPCSNEGGVIEWLYVPFIVEKYDNETADEITTIDETEESAEAEEL